MSFRKLVSLEIFVHEFFHRPPIVYPFGTSLEPPPQLTTLEYPPRQENPALKVQIRWLIRSDMPETLYIERKAFELPWMEEDFLCVLRQRNCIGMVAEYNHRIVGFMIYELHKAKLHILNFAVDPEFHRQAIGTQMIAKLVDKLSQQRRQEIVLEVRESNLTAQIFFKKMGFRAVLVLRSHYDDTDESAYVMRFSLEEETPAFLFTPENKPIECSPTGYINRIAKFYKSA